MIERLSISQVRTWLRCPRQWGYRYLGGYKEPPRWVMRAGTGMDDTLTVHNRGKMEGKGLNLSSAQDFFRDRVRELADTDGLPKDQEMATVIDDGTKMLPLYYKDFDPIVEPVTVQQKTEISVDGVPMLGYIDLVRKASDGHLITSDYKFTSRRPTGAAATSLQLAYYHEQNPDPTGHVELVGLVRTKTPQVVSDSHFITPANRATLRRAVKQVWKQIQKSVFPFPSPESEWGSGPSSFCNQQRCGYWHRCVGNPKGPEPIPGEVEV